MRATWAVSLAFFLLVLFALYPPADVHVHAGYYEVYKTSVQRLQTEVAKHHDQSSSDYKRFLTSSNEAIEAGKLSDVTDQELADATDVIDDVTDNIEMFSSDNDALLVAQGSLHIAGALLSIAGPVGGFFGNLFDLAANLLSIFYKSNMENILAEIISLALKEYEDSEIRSRANGHKSVLSGCKSALDKIIELNETATDGELSDIHSTCFPRDLVEFLGYMEEKIKDSARDASTPREATLANCDKIHEEQKRGMQRVRIYTDMGSMRDLILVELLSFYTLQGTATRVAIVLGFFETEHLRDYNMLKVLFAIPDLEMVGMATFFRADEEPTVDAYIKEREVPDVYDELIDILGSVKGSHLQMSPDKYPGYQIAHECDYLPPSHIDYEFYFQRFPFLGYQSSVNSIIVHESQVLDEYFVIDPLDYYMGYSGPFRKETISAPYEIMENPYKRIMRIYFDRPTATRWRVMMLSTGEVVFGGEDGARRCGFMCISDENYRPLSQCLGRPDSSGFWNIKILNMGSKHEPPPPRTNTIYHARRNRKRKIEKRRDRVRRYRSRMPALPKCLLLQQ